MGNFRKISWNTTTTRLIGCVMLGAGIVAFVLGTVIQDQSGTTSWAGLLTAAIGAFVIWATPRNA